MIETSDAVQRVVSFAAARAGVMLVCLMEQESTELAVDV